MAYELQGLDIGMLVTDADLSAKQFYAVKMSTTDNTVSLCDTDGEIILGILQNKPGSGEAASIRVQGITKAVAGEALTAGDKVGVDANGKLKIVETTNTGADIGDHWHGIVLDGAAADALATILIGNHSGRTESA